MPANYKGDIAFGYWRAHKDRKHPDNISYKGMPWPKISGAADQNFIKKCYSVQNSELVHTNRYKGFSTSRLTGNRLGCDEYEATLAGRKYAWPGDYVEHYLKAGVFPDVGFVLLIEWLHEKLQHKIKPR